MIFDHLGRKVLYDLAAKQLVICASGPHPENTAPIFLSASGEIVAYVSGEEILTGFAPSDVERIDDGFRLAISNGFCYATSVPDRDDIEFSAQIKNWWETFASVADGEEAQLVEAICLQDWYSVTHQRIARPGETVHSPGQFTFCDQSFATWNNKQALTGAKSGNLELTLYNAFSLQRLFRFNPLIYFVAFGPDLQMQLLATAIEALVKLGGYAGTIAIITDRSDALKYIPENFPGQIRVVMREPGTRKDYSFARYEIMDIPGIESYQPIVYMDTDVLCISPLERFLTLTLLSKKICVPVENHPGAPMAPSLHSYSDSVGKFLFEADGKFPRDEFGFNSGVIAFRNSEIAGFAFGEVANFKRRLPPAGLGLQWMDQPIANYVLTKLDAIDRNSISEMVSVGLLDRIIPYAHSNSKPIFIHFWPVLGEERLAVMRRQLEASISAHSSRTN